MNDVFFLYLVGFSFCLADDSIRTRTRTLLLLRDYAATRVLLLRSQVNRSRCMTLQDDDRSPDRS